MDVGETAIPPVALPETISAPVVEASLDESASAESEPVSQPAPISSQDRSDVPVQPEVPEVSVEVGEPAFPPVALPETFSAPVVKAFLDEPASAESETVSQPVPISSPDRSAIPVQPEVPEVASHKKIKLRRPLLNNQLPLKPQLSKPLSTNQLVQKANQSPNQPRFRLQTGQLFLFNQK